MPDNRFALGDVIECAAALVDRKPEQNLSDEYRRGVIELAALLCLGAEGFDDSVTVMGFAVYGVHRPPPGPDGIPGTFCNIGPCCLSDGHAPPCRM